MPYLPIDLDGRRDCAKAAAVLDVHPGLVSWALQDAWEYVWREHFAGRPDADVLPEIILLGCLGPVGAKPRALEVLVAFGFIDPTDTGYRIRGAAKWLFGLEGRRRGGQASKGNLRQFREPESSRESAGGATGLAPAQPAGSAGSKPTGSTPALSPSTQHPAPKKDNSNAGSLELLPVEADPHPADLLQSLWNDCTTLPLPRWNVTGKTRKRLAAAALQRRPAEQWREVFSRINRSPFLRGEQGGTWKADPDWAMRPDGQKPESAAAVLEGKYDPPANAKPPPREEPKCVLL